MRPWHVRSFPKKRFLSALPGRFFRQHHRLTQLHCVPHRYVLKHHRICGVHLLPRWDIRRCFECIIMPAMSCWFLLRHPRENELSRVPSQHVLGYDRSVAVHCLCERYIRTYEQHSLHDVLPLARYAIEDLDCKLVARLALLISGSSRFCFAVCVYLADTFAFFHVECRTDSKLVAFCRSDAIPPNIQLLVTLFIPSPLANKEHRTLGQPVIISIYFCSCDAFNTPHTVSIPIATPVAHKEHCTGRQPVALAVHFCFGFRCRVYNSINSSLSDNEHRTDRQLAALTVHLRERYTLDDRNTIASFFEPLHSPHALGFTRNRNAITAGQRFGIAPAKPFSPLHRHRQPPAVCHSFPCDQQFAFSLGVVQRYGVPYGFTRNGERVADWPVQLPVHRRRDQ